MYRSFTIAGLVALVPAIAMAQGELRIADLGSCRLESGSVIEHCRVGYRVFGQLDPARSNAVLVPTWFTGTSEDLAGLVGSEGLLDTADHFVVLVDAFGNGVSSSPSNSPEQQGAAFPAVTIRDMVVAQHRLATDVLGLDSLRAVLGLSMGGMQTFEWAVSYPEFVGKVVPIIGSPRLAAYDLALWETELRILELYNACRCEAAEEAVAGLMFLTLNTPGFHARSTARDSVQVALDRMVADGRLAGGVAYDIASQARAMIHHDVTASRGGSLEEAARRVRARMLVIVDEADHMVTPEPALEFAEAAGAEVLTLESGCGHMGPWCAMGDVAGAIRRFLREP